MFLLTIRYSVSALIPFLLTSFLQPSDLFSIRFVQLFYDLYEEEEGIVCVLLSDLLVQPDRACRNDLSSP